MQLGGTENEAWTEAVAEIEAIFRGNTRGKRLIITSNGQQTQIVFVVVTMMSRKRVTVFFSPQLLIGDFS